jgi:hypothetical protein
MAIVADEDDRLTFSVRPVQGAGILQGWSGRVACACSSGIIPLGRPLHSGGGCRTSCVRTIMVMPAGPESRRGRSERRKSNKC